MEPAPGPRYDANQRSNPVSPFRPVINFLASLKFLLINLGLLTAILLAAASYGVDITIGALRSDWYGSWWFNILMAALMVNLTVCTLVRKPWEHHWRWGFLVTHTGILTLMIGSAVTFNSKIYGDMQLREGQQSDWFEIEHEREVLVQSTGGPIHKVAVPYGRYKADRTRRTQKLPDSRTYVHLEEYLPHVGIAGYVAGPPGSPSAAKLRIHMEGQEDESRWVAEREGAEYGGMLSLQVARLDDALWRNISEPAGPKGTLVVVLGGATGEIDVDTQMDKPVKVGDAEVTAREIDAEYRHGGHHGRPDYAVKFDLKRADGSTSTWRAFTFETAASPQRVGEGAPADFQARLRVSLRESMIMFAMTETGLKYLCQSRQGKKVAGEAKVGAKIPYPFMPMAFEVELQAWLDSAVEHYEEAAPAKDSSWRPALRLTVADGEKSETKWVRFGDQPANFQPGATSWQVYFGGKRFENLPFSIHLKKFEKPENPGQPGSAMKFESKIVLEDHVTSNRTEHSILVNHPLAIHGYDVYQASYAQDGAGRWISVFQIAWDPGKKILYLGGLMAVSGTIFMFFLQPFLKGLIKAGAKASDPPLGSLGIYGWLTLATLGTLAGGIWMLLRPGTNGVALGFAIAGADILLVFLLAAVASWWTRTRPGRALQLGQILSASWCINTAALTALMWMKVGR